MHTAPEGNIPPAAERLARERLARERLAREPLDIDAALAGQRILITGATGFVGKVLVEKLLWSLPEIGRLLLLIRAPDDTSAAQRLDEEILGSPIMARLRALHGDRWNAWVADKVEAVAGDLGSDRFGLGEKAYQALCARVDRVVASAATVTFDERLDRAYEANVRGAQRTLALARDAGDVPLLYVSTCFVSGRRAGAIAERVVDAEALDPEATCAALERACARLRAAEEDGEADDRAWVAAGAEQAARLGFHDVYTLTKALAETLLARDRAAVPLAILRPAIVESAITAPIPGWIEAVRVVDPLLVAYGRGKAESLPGSADATLELVPVDLVANGAIVALAALPRAVATPATADATAGGADEIPVYQLGSSRNPIALGELMAHARRGFARVPLRDSQGAPIEVREARFEPPDRYLEQLEARRRRLRALRLIPRRRTSRARLTLAAAERTLDHLRHLLAVYRPYLDHGARYQDRQVLGLWQRLSKADRGRFPFDVGAVDWPSYIARVHVPGVVRFALRAGSGAPVPEPDAARLPRAELLARAAARAADARTVFDLFAATAAGDPEAMALQTCRGGRWLRYTYGQALDTTANVAARMAAQHDIGRGDRVMLWSSGCPEWVIATLAVHRLGATVVPLDPQWPAAEAAQAARLVEAKLACPAPQLAADLAAADPGCPVVALAAPFVPEPEVGLLPGNEDVGVVGESGDLASIIFTSGTTVAPKSVPLTHANYLANVRDLVPLMKLTRERLLSVLPIHHVFEQMVGWLVPMAGGSTISYVAELKPAEISWMMSTTRPTVLVAVPRLLELLDAGIRANVAAGGAFLKLVFRVLFALSRREDGADGHRLFKKVHQRFGGSLRRIATGGSALDPALGRRFQLMGFRVAEGYGMTETSPVLTVNPWDEIRFGAVGKPLPSVEVELRAPAEDTGELAPGVGEIWVRGPNVMTGYFRNAGATAEAMRDSWLNTGDLGFFDEDGYLHIAGRTKDVIVTSAGKNVYPEEVEARYKDLPGVAELVVLGLPADGGGEQVTALIVPGPDADEDAIRAAIDLRGQSVPSYQQVAGVRFWRGDLPKTTTMKVKRAVLLEAVLAGERGSGATATAPPTPTPAERRSEEQQAVVEALARLTRARPDLVRADDRLADLGVDSLTRVELVGELEARFGVRLDDRAAASLERVRDLYALGG